MPRKWYQTWKINWEVKLRGTITINLKYQHIINTMNHTGLLVCMETMCRHHSWGPPEAVQVVLAKTPWHDPHSCTLSMPQHHTGWCGSEGVPCLFPSSPLPLHLSPFLSYHPSLLSFLMQHLQYCSLPYLSFPWTILPFPFRIYLLSFSALTIYP